MGISAKYLLGKAALKVYLAGPIKSNPDYFEDFAKGADQLRQDGHEVFNPAAANLEKWSLREIFAYELNWICREAEAIALLPGWEKSDGVAAELATAKVLGLEIIPL